MLPALQPSRPKLPSDTQRSYAHQQRRSVHIPAEPQPRPNPKAPIIRSTSTLPARPKNQIEAMPPFMSAPSAPLFPPRAMYDSAVRHPVFFTEQLRKPPFPIPEMACHGWNPVANGYILEQKRRDANAAPRTKL
ncbi:hypothetical protein BDV96DRAFT_217337 [Lophiotrema nucula]|uniref:Uncharacterized protein n=1 Tax=Lophiotrema nucula TaxID=690887 RepID=A0A6A5ZTK0_9PLEO|nr:hypothetical protein BDV96DRAFT_217337 [Lophiotrema nucula]